MSSLWVSSDKKAHVSFRGSVSADMVFCTTLAHLSTAVYLLCQMYCSCTNMYAHYPVRDKVFSLNYYTPLHVISGAITLVSGVCFLESRSDMLWWGNHNTTIPVIDTSHKAFSDAMFLQEEKGEKLCFSKWKTNGVGWKLVEEWKVITTFVFLCQPQGCIPEIRIPTVEQVFCFNGSTDSTKMCCQFS